MSGSGWRGGEGGACRVESIGERIEPRRRRRKR